MPSSEEMGKLLGFPSSKLVIEEVTLEERIILQTPSRREKSRKTVLPDPAVLLKAYHIRGKNEKTFIPIQIYIGTREAFLTSEVLVKIEKFMEGIKTRSPTWGMDFESLGTGGLYYTNDHKVKSEVPGFKNPSLVVAEVIVLQPHGQNFDVKIVMRSSLPQGIELQPVPGGEAYYSIFGSTEERKAEPRLDAPTMVFELSKTVITAWLLEQKALGVLPPKQPAPSEQTTPTKPVGVAPPTGPPSTPSSTTLRWWQGVLALVVLALIANALRKRRR